MKCPKCGTTENIKWMLRHQVEEGEPEGCATANVITILCTECGHNFTVFIRDYLEDIFPNWSERPPQNMDMSGLGGLGMLGSLFGGGFGGPPQSLTGWRSATNANEPYIQWERIQKNTKNGEE